MCNKKNKIMSILGLSLLAFMVSTNINVINVSASTSVKAVEASGDKWSYKDNNWYYLDTSGKSQTGWIINDASGFKYRLDGEGKMQTGWNHIEDSWYYFDVKTGAMKTGWLQDKNWYYFNDDGTMAINATIEGYMVDDNGILVID